MIKYNKLRLSEVFSMSSNYKKLERFLTILLIIDFVVFLLFFISTIAGGIVLRVISILLLILICPYGLWMLYNNKELFTQRSLWLTCGFGGILICTLVSLICNYPSL